MIYDQRVSIFPGGIYFIYEEKSERFLNKRFASLVDDLKTSPAILAIIICTQKSKLNFKINLGILC
jgi:hypothetical protein